jgi:hypothetical protein
MLRQKSAEDQASSGSETAAERASKNVGDA